MYREYSTAGKVRGRIVTHENLRRPRVVPDQKPWFPQQEAELVREFGERRKVGDRVTGKWLKAKMKLLVNRARPSMNAMQLKKADRFKASLRDRWLTRCAKENGMSYRKKTNNKAKSAIMRSAKVRRFHWFCAYKARLLPSKRSAEWKRMVRNRDPLTVIRRFL